MEFDTILMLFLFGMLLGLPISVWLYIRFTLKFDK